MSEEKAFSRTVVHVPSFSSMAIKVEKQIASFIHCKGSLRTHPCGLVYQVYICLVFIFWETEGKEMCSILSLNCGVSLASWVIHHLKIPDCVRETLVL